MQASTVGHSALKGLVHSFTKNKHAKGHTKHKTFEPRTHHTRFIQMLADV